MKTPDAIAVAAALENETRNVMEPDFAPLQIVILLTPDKYVITLPIFPFVPQIPS